MPFAGIARYVLDRVWFVHPPVRFFLRIAPAMSIDIMRVAAKPSTQRLHLRNLFADGRRYFIEPLTNGFRMVTTRTVIFRYGRRTSATAILRGRFSAFGDYTQVDLTARINVGYLLSSFLMPSFMASLLVFMPWPSHIIVLLIVALYALSWIGHRYNARAEAHEMVWFVQKTLEDAILQEIPSLPPASAEVLDLHTDFEAEWSRFINRLQDDDPKG
jgi:hypothetical protein